MSVEFITVIGVLILMITAGFYYAARDSTETVAYTKGDLAARKIIENADIVGSLGIGSENRAWIEMPENIREGRIAGKEIMLSNSKGAEFVGISQFNLIGQISTDSGRQYVKFKKIGPDTVMIGNLNDTAAPYILSKNYSVIELNQLMLNVVTDEYAYCKYDTANKSYSQMAFTFNGFHTNHTDTI